MVRKVYKAGMISVIIDEEFSYLCRDLHFKRSPKTKRYHYPLAPGEYEIFGRAGGF